jgi:hypothetical protein
MKLPNVTEELQRLLNAGMWGLEGSTGRAMMQSLENGDTMLGEKDTKDYWGNHIPSRFQVEEGSVGSRGYVVEVHGEEWAQALEQVKGGVL